VVIVQQKDFQAAEQDLTEDHHTGHNLMLVEAVEQDNKDLSEPVKLESEETELQTQLQDRQSQELVAAVADLILVTEMEPLEAAAVAAKEEMVKMVLDNQEQTHKAAAVVELAEDPEFQWALEATVVQEQLF
jgi:hypothetical protein